MSYRNYHNHQFPSVNSNIQIVTTTGKQIYATSDLLLNNMEVPEKQTHGMHQVSQSLSFQVIEPKLMKNVLNCMHSILNRPINIIQQTHH